MAYSDILDVEVQAYKPVTARLIKKIRNNIRASAIQVFRGTGSQYTENTAPASYTTVFTLRFWIPDCFIGASGARLVLKALLSVNTTGFGNANWRLETGGDTSNAAAVTSTGGTDTSEATFTLDWTPTGNAYVDINVQAQDGGSGYNSSIFTWSDGRCDSYLESLPR